LISRVSEITILPRELFPVLTNFDQKSSTNAMDNPIEDFAGCYHEVCTPLTKFPSVATPPFEVNVPFPLGSPFLNSPS